MAETTHATHLDAVRERNLARVLRAVARHQPATRARLAELTGLTKTTVAGQVAALERLRLVVDAEPVRAGGRGRPGAPVSLARGPVAALGLEVNGQYLAACLLDMSGAVRAHATVPGDNRGRGPHETVADLAGLASRVAAEAAASGLTVVGTAVALPGVFVENRVNAPNLAWVAVPAAEMLTAALPAQPLGVVADNEANYGALGELWYGAGQGAGSYLYLSGETGIGAGIVVGGELFRGAHGAAGEIGHLVVEPDGPACRCGGSGCLEQVAGLDALLRNAGLAVAAGGTAAGLAELERRLTDGDPAALRAVDAAGAGLAVALVGAVHLLDPDTVVLGGIHARLAPWLVPAVEASVARAGSRLRGCGPAVRAASLGADSAVRGAAGTVIARILADPGALA